MKALLVVFLLCAPLAAQVSFSGNSLNGVATASSNSISGLTANCDANTCKLSWTTSQSSNTSASCISVNCSGQAAPYDSTQNAVTSHTIAVPELSPSTTYTLQACSNAACQTVSGTTQAYATSTPITSLSFGTITDYNAGAAHPMYGDTFFNAVASNGSTYILSTDTSGWNGGSYCEYADNIGVATLSPIAVSDVNNFSGYGAGCVGDPLSDLSAHFKGLFAMNGKLFATMTQDMQCSGNPTCDSFYGSMIVSPDNGATWDNQSSPGTFTSTGALNSPYTLRLSPNGPPYFDGCQFIMYGADDGTMGYSVADNRVQNANVYVYQLCNAVTGTGQSSTAGDSMYLRRIPRAQLADLNPAEYQYYTGGDGTQAAAWSYTQSSATAVLTYDCNSANLPAHPGCLSGFSAGIIPALNRYLFLTSFWVQGTTNGGNTTWLGYESPAPWGPWTQVYSNNYPTQGYYGPIILQADALAATFASTTMRVLFDGNYTITADYHLYYWTMTVNH